MMTRGSRWLPVALVMCACSARGMDGGPPAPDGEAPADTAVPKDVPGEVAAGQDAPDAAAPPDVAPPDVAPIDAQPADVPDDARRPCARDGDCTGLSLCGPAGFCVPLTCTPGRSVCVDATRLEVCDARGAASSVTECPAGCADGACTRCPSPTTACAGRCVATATDPSHCGACGRACASDQACEGGACVVPCASPRTRCGPVCVDLQSDAANCGGCGRACPASQVCMAGACAAVCTATMTRCGAACADLQTDATNCGGCGIACPTGQVCEGGACTLPCSAPMTRCGAACVNPQTDASNCGACGRACPTGQVCEAGVCAVPCGAPMTRCGAACVNPQTDASNCGACGRACSAGQSCMSGACVTGCPSPRVICGAACVDTQLDASNCGACGRACSAGAACSAGSCVTPPACASPRVTCGAACVDTQLDASNCGACGRACAVGLACNGGVCGPLASDAFQVVSLDTGSSCRTIEHYAVTGDDRGGIAVSSSNVFYSGDTATTRASLSDLSGAAAVGALHDGMLSDLATGEVYVLLNAAGAEPTGSSLSTAFTATQLGVLDGATGALTARRVPLSSPIAFANNSGIFSGRGQAYFFTGPATSTGSWVQVRLPSGAVTTLRTGAPPPTRMFCENWATWGVAEYFGGEPYAAYVESATSIARYRIRDGAITAVAALAAGTFSDMCSFTVSPARGRWYFHYEGAGFAGGTMETLGSCAATVSVGGACPSPLATCGATCANLQVDPGNCGACGRMCASPAVCSAGACACPVAGQTPCSGRCVDTATDVANCGACGVACAAGQVCAAGRCGCAAAQTACGAACVDLQSSAANCGACGRACASGQYCVRGACGSTPPLYHGWTCPIAGCSTASYNTTAPTNQGGTYPYNTGDSNACRAWKLAATVCTTEPAAYFGNDNWNCPMAGGFTDPVFGAFCAVANQYSCSTCPAACNASCLYTPLSLRNCSGTERAQP